jgi:2-beta-glucuronyltransferase
MPKVVFLTGHYAEAKRKAGFHWLADAFWRHGWDVLFFTQSLSWLSRLRNDVRFAYPVREEANRVRVVRERFKSFVWYKSFHPVNLRLHVLNWLSTPFLRLYGKLPLHGIEKELADANLFVFDSDHGLLLFDRIRRINPHARYVYRVSDDIPAMRNHPLLVQQEARVAGRFDLVSVPSEYIQRRLAHHCNVKLHKHGLRKDLFDRDSENPYATPKPNVLYVGREYFDADAVERAAKLFPAWSFTVFGVRDYVPGAPNIAAYPERPFEEIVPYLKHADIGLQTRSYSPGAEALTDSLKMHQYTYCRLPIVAPEFLRNDRPHVFYYRPGDDATIRQALLDAHAFDRGNVPVGEVQTWDDIIVQLAGPLGQSRDG